MPLVPFNCGNCGKVYGDGGIDAQGEIRNLTLRNNRMACPQCGEFGSQSLEDGVYDVRDGSFRLVRSLAEDLLSEPVCRRDLEDLARLLRSAQSHGGDSHEVADEIARNTRFRRLSRSLKDHPPGWGAYVVGTLIQILLFLIPLFAQGHTVELTPSQIDDISRSITHQLDAIPQAQRESASPTR